MRDLVKYWQLIVYLLSLALGAGITLSAVRNSERRLDRMEEHGTSVARAAAKHADELDRRVVFLEGANSTTQRLLERIDERTKNIVDRLDRFDKRTP
jgi:hypothetical protein